MRQSRRKSTTVAYLQRAFATCKAANANKVPHVPDHFTDDAVDSGAYIPGQGSSYNSARYFLTFLYKVARDPSQYENKLRKITHSHCQRLLNGKLEEHN